MIKLIFEEASEIINIVVCTIAQNNQAEQRDFVPEILYKLNLSNSGFGIIWR